MIGTPLYMEVYRDICEKIKNGTYSENSALPAERVLCEMYHVSRSTLRHALDELSRDGYIVKVHGNGNFVKAKVFEQKLTKFHSFAGSLKAQHILIKNQILDYELIDTDKYLDSIDLSRQKSPPNTKWHKLVRLRSAETYPLMIETSYFPQSRFMTIDTDILRDGSLYSYLETYYNMEITDASEVLSPLLPNNKERMLLQIPPHIPCMLCERFCHERESLIIIHRTVVRGDKFKFKAAYYVDDPLN
ncbi:MAG TPA: GntR family transcriptional regulator [Clostridiales bacterium]|nr:GntR family transcriptional regulator [Clostridiales bacterium]